MKTLRFILISIINVLFTSADPNLFGSRKRRKEKEKLASEFKDMATGTQAEIETLKTADPFQSAAAKSAMTQSARRARQMQQRYANILGGRATPESAIAAQQATQEAVAGTAGQIAVGGEAQKQAQLARLRGEKMGQMGQYAGISESAIAERGTGWTKFFQELLPAIGGGMEAAGGIMEAGKMASAGAALSDINLKENIVFIGELQEQKIYKYNFKGNSVVHIGVIAQEVQKENPDMVVQDGEVLKVRYNELFESVS